MIIKLKDIDKIMQEQYEFILRDKSNAQYKVVFDIKQWCDIAPNQSHDCKTEFMNLEDRENWKYNADCNNSICVAYNNKTLRYEAFFDDKDDAEHMLYDVTHKLCWSFRCTKIIRRKIKHQNKNIKELIPIEKIHRSELKENYEFTIEESKQEKYKLIFDTKKFCNDNKLSLWDEFNCVVERNEWENRAEEFDAINVVYNPKTYYWEAYFFNSVSVKAMKYTLEEKERWIEGYMRIIPIRAKKKITEASFPSSYDDDYSNTSSYQPKTIAGKGVKLASQFIRALKPAVRQIASNFKNPTEEQTKAKQTIVVYIKYLVKTSEKKSNIHGKAVSVFLSKGIFGGQPLFFDTRDAARATAQAKGYSVFEFSIIPAYIATTLMLKQNKVVQQPADENTSIGTVQTTSIPLTFQQFASIKKSLRKKYSKVFWNNHKLKQWVSGHGYVLQFDDPSTENDALQAEEESMSYEKSDTYIIRKIWLNSSNKYTFSSKEAANSGSYYYVTYPDKYYRNDQDALSYTKKKYKKTNDLIKPKEVSTEIVKFSDKHIHIVAVNEDGDTCQYVKIGIKY